MEVKYHVKALKELQELDEKVQVKFLALFSNLEEGEVLPRTKYKKLAGRNLFEARVKHNTNIFRAIVAVVKPDLIILLIFQKKTQKTPQKEITTAIKRLNDLK
jgi:phage-related protein